MNLYNHTFSILYTVFRVDYCRLGWLEQFKVGVKYLVIVNLGGGCTVSLTDEH